jgi:Cys-tRNA(Pro)/Cys-tRNA(Cys) deacylase
MAEKLNSIRILEQNKIPYEVFEYDNSFHDAQEVAEILGLPNFMLYKTLIVEAINDPSQVKPFVALVPSHERLNLKKLAAVIGIKKAKMVSHKDAEALTGLQVGGISPLALTSKNWKMFIDRQATELQHVVISAGQRGFQLRVPLASLVSLLRLRVANISEPDDNPA